MESIKKDDLVLVLRPNFDGNEWNGTVDLNMMCMPSENLSEESYTELIGLMQGLVTCFHLMNRDEEFGAIVAEEMDAMIKSGELNFSPMSSEDEFNKIIDLTQWTQTRGNA